MKLLYIQLDGTYKCLKDQTFDFSNSSGNALAFIGLNGSGKSQLLELISESFAYLERYCRDDFKTRTSLGFSVTIKYQIRPPYIQEQYFETWRAIINHDGSVLFDSKSETEWMPRDSTEAVLPTYVIGYSSGLNENLQRSFLKNTVQYFDVMSIRANRRKKLSAQDVDGKKYEKINAYYKKRYPGIFFSGDAGYGSNTTFGDSTEKDTEMPANIFLDYDCNALIMASLGIIRPEELDNLFPDIVYRYPQIIKIAYDLRKVPFEQDAISDIKQLTDITGQQCVEGNCNRTSDKEYDLYELDYLAATITIDLSNHQLFEIIRDRYFESPLRLFEKLYKIQLLGVKSWQAKDKRNLRKDSFFGNVKKPLKTKLPLEIIELKLSNNNNSLIDFDDLSDGEAQLIQTLGAAYIFSQENTLFIYDEPETHLNPAWRTHYHQHLSNAIDKNNIPNKNVQIFLSTHSPFLLSSLRNDNVYLFKVLENGITMETVSDKTYGAAFDVLIRKYFGLKSLISHTAVDEIKKHLHELNLSDAEKREWIENNVGDSMEKAYLLRKLRD